MLSCHLCTQQGNCPLDSTYLYTASGVLAERVAGLLTRIEVPFERHQSEFVFGESVAREYLVELLGSQLSEQERCELRVGGAEVPDIRNGPTLEMCCHHLQARWFEEALANDRFTCHFQPIVDVHSGRVFGHECLIRLELDRILNGREILDAAFLWGEVHLFDAYARQLGVRRAKAGYRRGSRLFINFLPTAINQPEECLRTTMETIDQHGIDRADVVFEVVESETVADIPHLKTICNYFRQEGFGVALDDMGSGTNSLHLACELQPDYLKIDKSLIGNLTNPMMAAAVRHIAELCHEFGIIPIAEGVETPQMCQAAKTLGVDLMQGYLFGHPSPFLHGPSADMTPLDQALRTADCLPAEFFLG